MYASFIARNSDRQYDVVWEGLTYRRTSREGATGVVVFCKHGAVGAFFEPKSPKNPKTSKKKISLAALVAEHTKGMPTPLAGVAKRDAFPAMTIDTDDPVVTSVFWNDATGALVGTRPWPKLVEDGVHLIENELLKPEACITTLAQLYAFDDARTRAVMDTFATQEALAEPANARVKLSESARTALALLPNTATRELLQGAGIDLG
jgi:hypothetical protein